MTSNDNQQLLPPAPGTPPTPPKQAVQKVPAESPHTPRVAVASLIFGLMAFFTMLIFIGTFPAIIAVITGHVAISRIRHSNGQLVGHAVAVTGVVLGYMTLVGTSVLMLVVLISFHPAQRALTEYRQQHSMRNASHLYLASEAYAREHKGRYPQKWDDLRGRYVSSVDLDDYLQSVYSFRESKKPAFKLVPHQRPVLPAVASQVVVIQEIAPPRIDLISVVYSDGTTELIANPNRSSDP